VEAILEMGVDARTGCHIGQDISLSSLLSEHSAVFMATGTGRGRDLDLPGRDLDGVLLAVEFLININKGFHADLGQRVVVVGGGNVAFDAARTTLRAYARGEPSEPVTLGPAAREDAARGMTTTLDTARAARRAGVRDVTVIALESPEEIPAAPEEIAEAEEEGITVVYRRGPHRFLGTGRITGLETIGVASVFDDAGRFAPVFVPGTEDVIAADTVILAVGQSADLSYLGESLDLARDARGNPVIDRTTLSTSHPRVWMGGDVAFGPRNLIDAIADGRRAAASIHHGLEEAQSRGHEIVLSSLPRFRRLATGYDAMPRVHVPTVATGRRVGFGEVELGYDERGAWLESLRCLRCFENVMLEPELCILCGLCVDVCPNHCISIARADRVHLGPESSSVLLLDEDLCIRCGLCVNRCPPGALLMVTAKERS
jgi:formate dehydrogenase (NADP+) beta subunit